MDVLQNWAGNYTYSTTRLHYPNNVEQVQQLVSRLKRLKVLGTCHSFNGIADSTENLISLQHFNNVLTLDEKRRTVTVEAGIKYGDLGTYLHTKGYALHNMASLPHITVVGACATATHGSGDHNGSLATAVGAIEIVTASGELLQFSREHDNNFEGVVVGLGALGVVTKLTLNLIPAYDLRQTVYENLPLISLKEHFNDIFASAYSVSLFTTWKQENFNQVWLKHRNMDQASYRSEPEFYGATAAENHLNPVPGSATINCNEQMGIPGPWHERLPHFRMDFTPSSGEELQSEYIIPRGYAFDALCAIDKLREHISPLLYISEVRSIAGDDLWMSPFYKQHSIAIHFTWKADWERVRKILPMIEEQLKPFNVRPHWGKLFTMSSVQLQQSYERLPDFQQLIRQYDPEGKFNNAFINSYILSENS